MLECVKRSLLLFLFAIVQVSAAWFAPAAKKPSKDLLPLLNQLCPGSAFADENAIGCRVCPEVIRSRQAPLVATGATVGHFLSPGTQTLLISTAGCEAHANGFGGTAVFERLTGEWKLLRYLGGVITDRCRIVARRDHRDVLLCAREDGHQGEQWFGLVKVDLSDAEVRGKIVFNIFDTMAASCSSGAQLGNIDRVQFGARNGVNTAAISVWVNYGIRSYSTAELSACRNGNALPRPQVKTYRVDCVWDGSDFEEAPWNTKVPAPGVRKAA